MQTIFPKWLSIEKKTTTTQHWQYQRFNSQSSNQQLIFLNSWTISGHRFDKNTKVPCNGKCDPEKSQQKPTLILPTFPDTYYPVHGLHQLVWLFSVFLSIMTEWPKFNVWSLFSWQIIYLDVCACVCVSVCFLHTLLQYRFWHGEGNLL